MQNLNAVNPDMIKEVCKAKYTNTLINYQVIRTLKIKVQGSVQFHLAFLQPHLPSQPSLARGMQCCHTTPTP
jgi:hypothetical protein